MQPQDNIIAESIEHTRIRYTLSDIVQRGLVGTTHQFSGKGMKELIDYVVSVYAAGEQAGLKRALEKVPTDFHAEFCAKSGEQFEKCPACMLEDITVAISKLIHPPSVIGE
ncbi:MAG: hypothetical protein PHI63_05915 [Patescibacteria group bacterium]|nr:hypothetical protein [Patescibacteria group bacterium]